MKTLVTFFNSRMPREGADLWLEKKLYLNPQPHNIQRKHMQVHGKEDKALDDSNVRQKNRDLLLKTLGG